MEAHCDPLLRDVYIGLNAGKPPQCSSETDTLLYDALRVWEFWNATH